MLHKSPWLLGHPSSDAWCWRAAEVVSKDPRPHPNSERKNNFTPMYLLGFLRVGLWWWATDLKAKLVVPELTAQCISPSCKLMQVFVPFRPAPAHLPLLLCSSKQQIGLSGCSRLWVLRAGSCWSNARFEGVKEFVLPWLLAVFSHPPLEHGSCLPDARGVNTLTRARQVSGVTDPPLPSCRNWSGSQNPPPPPVGLELREQWQVHAIQPFLTPCWSMR